MTLRFALIYFVGLATLTSSVAFTDGCKDFEVNQNRLLCERPLSDDLLDQAMRSLTGNPKLEQFFTALAKRGPIKIFRSQQHPHEKGFGTLGYMSGSYPHGLFLTDLFFRNVAQWIKTCEGFMFENVKTEISRIILHELVHLFDSSMNYLSRDCSFLKAVNWDEETETYAGVDQTELLSLRKEGVKRMETDKSRVPAIWSMGKAQSKGFPTLYSMTEPVETLAELLTFYALDEKAPTYFKPDVLKWLDQYLTQKAVDAVYCPLKSM